MSEQSQSQSEQDQTALDFEPETNDELTKKLTKAVKDFRKLPNAAAYNWLLACARAFQEDWKARNF